MATKTAATAKKTAKETAGKTKAGAKTKAVTPKKTAAPTPASKAGKGGAKATKTVDAPRQRPEREKDENGFIPGTESARIVELMLEGAEDRKHLNQIIRDEIGVATRNDTEKNVSSLVSGLLRRMEERGYTVESSWRLVPPEPAKTTAKKGRK